MTSPAFNQAVTANFSVRPHPALSYILQHCAMIHMCATRKTVCQFLCGQDKRTVKKKKASSWVGKGAKYTLIKGQSITRLDLLYFATNQSAVINGHHSLTVIDKGQTQQAKSFPNDPTLPVKPLIFYFCGLMSRPGQFHLSRSIKWQL